MQVQRLKKSSVSTPGAETRLLTILDVSGFFYMAAAEPRHPGLFSHDGYKGTEGEKCSRQNLKAHNAKTSCHQSATAVSCGTNGV